MTTSYTGMLVEMHAERDAARITMLLGQEGGGAMEVEPTIPFPRIPVPPLPASPREYHRRRHETRERFAHRVRIAARYHQSQMLRQQAWMLLQGELLRRGKSASELRSLKLVLDRLERNVAALGYVGDVQHRRPPLDEVLEGVRVVNEMVGVKAREPTPQEAVDLYGSVLGEHIVRAGTYDELVLQRNGFRAPETGKRRAGHTHGHGHKRRPEPVSARGRADEEEQEEEETVPRRMARDRRRRAEKRKLAEATLRGKDKPVAFQRADLREDLTDAETKALLDRFDQLEEVQTEVTRNALTKLMSERSGGGGGGASTGAMRGSWSTLVSVWWDHDTPLKRALVRRYSFATLSFMFMAGGYVVLQRLTSDGVDKLLHEMRETRQRQQKALAKLRDAAAGLSPARDALKNAEDALGRMQNAILAARLHLNESEELIRAEFGSVGSFMSQWRGDLTRLSEKLRSPAINEPQEADELLSSYNTLNTMLSRAVEKIVEQVHKGQDIQAEKEDIITEMSDAIGRAYRKVALLESELKESVQDFGALSVEMKQLSDRAHELPRSSAFLLTGLLVKKFTDLHTTVFGGFRLDAAVAVEVAFAPLRAFESMVLLSFAGGDAAEARELLHDVVWRCAETAAGWWSAMQITGLFQWLRGAVTTPTSIFRKQQLGEPLAPDEQLRVGLAQMVDQAQGSEQELREQLPEARHFAPVSWVLRTVPAGIIQFLSTTGYAVGSLASLMMFGMGLSSMYTAAASVPLAATYSVAALSPLIMARYELPGFADRLRAWARSDSSLVANSARRLRLLISPSAHVLNFARGINLITSFTSGGNTGVAAYFAVEVGCYLLHAQLVGMFGTPALELLFHLLQAEQVGIYVRDVMHMVNVEKHCLEEADLAYTEEKARADALGHEVSEQQYLELQERALFRCREAQRRAFLEHPPDLRFWDRVAQFVQRLPGFRTQAEKKD